MRIKMIDLKETLEKLRSEKFQDLDKQLVSDIVDIQANFMENQTEAYKRITKIIEKFVQAN
jgi:hypothetical protein